MKKKVKKSTKKATQKVTAFACSFPTAIGEMAIAWNQDSILGVFLPEATSEKLLARVRKRTASPKLAWTQTPPTNVGHLAAQIRAHLRGEPQEFSLEGFAIKKGSPFTRKVYECSLRIPSGTVVTYRELAEKAGSPKAFRAVGQAMARNPFPIVVPCHRVVGTGKPSKNPGGFSAHGGLDTKARILKLEGNSSLE